MTEKERIIELVKNGVLSTEEGLDLIEGLAKKEDKRMVDKEFSQESFDRESLEDNLESAASDILDRSEQIDSLNAEIKDYQEDLSALEADLDTAMDNYNGDLIKDLKAEIKDRRKERDLIKDLDEVENSEELDQIDQEIKDLESELANQEEIYEENQKEIEDLSIRVGELSLLIEELTEERDDMLKDVDGSRSEWFAKNFEDLKSQFEFSDDWKEETSKKVDKAGKDFSKMIKDAVDTFKGSFDHFEWTKRDFKMPTLVSQELTKEWTISDKQPTIFDIKNANGDVTIQAGDIEEIQIKADITLYGKFEEEKEEAFEKRSIYNVTDDTLKFHIPNKRVKADVTITLPKDTHDYLSVNVLNGDIKLVDLALSDLFVKSVNGDIKLKDIKATMAEVKGTSGDIGLIRNNLQDLIVSTINGDLKAEGNIVSSSVSTTNGDIRLTLNGSDLVQVEAGSVNGDVKVALPKEGDLEVDARTSFGSIYSRLSDVEIEKENDKQTELVLKRSGQGHAARVKAKTTQGNILLKDSK